MDAEDFGKWALIIGVCLIALVFIVFCACAMFSEHEFMGYYLYSGKIYRAIQWSPDERACDFTEKRWQQILDDDLFLKIEN